jgi:hypothetical protein
MNVSEKLIKLYNELIDEGCDCNSFYIDGISKSIPNDTFCLDNDGQKWKIYYTEMGEKTDIYSTYDLIDAINYYKKYIMEKVEHWHLICFTRSIKTLDKYRNVLKQNEIEVIENNIPAYKHYGDCVFRIFVNGKDIFRANELFDDIPYYDEDLK